MLSLRLTLLAHSGASRDGDCNGVNKVAHVFDCNGVNKVAHKMFVMV